MTHRSLYICVDESGSESTDEYFTVAACWFVSSNGPRAALNETQTTLRSLLIDCEELPSGVDELKGKNLQPTGTDLLFRSFQQTVRGDNTIEQSILPWSGFPVRYRTVELDVSVGRNALRDLHGDIPVEMSMRTLLLLSVLNPILYNSGFTTETYDDVRIVLDGDIWSQPKESLEATDRAGEFDFSIKDSKKVPGIQFADVAANLRFTARRGADFDDALGTLSSLEF